MIEQIDTFLKPMIKTISDFDKEYILSYEFAKLGNNKFSTNPINDSLLVWALKDKNIGLYTDNVYDCTSLVIFDGKKIFLSHQDTDIVREDKYFYQILKKELKQYFKHKDVKVFLLGGTNDNRFKKICDFKKKHSEALEFIFKTVRDSKITDKIDIPYSPSPNAQTNSKTIIAKTNMITLYVENIKEYKRIDFELNSKTINKINDIF